LNRPRRRSPLALNPLCSCRGKRSRQSASTERSIAAVAGERRVAGSACPEAPSEPSSFLGGPRKSSTEKWQPVGNTRVGARVASRSTGHQRRASLLTLFRHRGSPQMTVYVQLLNEGSSAYRPTEAEVLGPEIVRLQATPNYDPEDETWEFLPGTQVRWAPMKLESGEVPVALAPVDSDLHRCRVCGLPIDDFIPWEEFRQHPGENTCPCCGVRWGTYDTLDLSCRHLRDDWLSKGTPWGRPEKRPARWSLGEQLTHVPEMFR
jgi:hypothetical protein